MAHRSDSPMFSPVGKRSSIAIFAPSLSATTPFLQVNRSPSSSPTVDLAPAHESPLLHPRCPEGDYGMASSGALRSPLRRRRPRHLAHDDEDEFAHERQQRADSSRHGGGFYSGSDRRRKRNRRRWSRGYDDDAPENCSRSRKSRRGREPLVLEEAEQQGPFDAQSAGSRSSKMVPRPPAYPPPFMLMVGGPQQQRLSSSLSPLRRRKRTRHASRRSTHMTTAVSPSRVTRATKAKSTCRPPRTSPFEVTPTTSPMSDEESIACDGRRDGRNVSVPEGPKKRDASSNSDCLSEAPQAAPVVSAQKSAVASRLRSIALLDVPDVKPPKQRRRKSSRGASKSQLTNLTISGQDKPIELNDKNDDDVARSHKDRHIAVAKQEAIVVEGSKEKETTQQTMIQPKAEAEASLDHQPKETMIKPVEPLPVEPLPVKAELPPPPMPPTSRQDSKPKRDKDQAAHGAEKAGAATGQGSPQSSSSSESSSSYDSDSDEESQQPRPKKSGTSAAAKPNAWGMEADMYGRQMHYVQWCQSVAMANAAACAPIPAIVPVATVPCVSAAPPPPPPPNHPPPLLPAHPKSLGFSWQTHGALLPKVGLVAHQDARCAFDIEHFMRKYRVSPDAQDKVRLAPTHHQEIIMARGPLFECRQMKDQSAQDNPTKELLARLSAIQRLQPEADCDPFVEAYLLANRSIQLAADKFRELPQWMKEEIMSRGYIGNEKNPSKKLIEWMLELDRSYGAKHRESIKQKIEDLINLYKLTPKCAWELRILPHTGKEKVLQLSSSFASHAENLSEHILEQIKPLSTVS